MQVHVEAAVKPTEDEAKVRQAVTSLLPDAQLDRTPDGLAGQARDLLPLRRRIFELRIIDTFRGQLLHGMDAAKRSAAVRLSKQAALAGKVSFAPRPHPLGDIELRIAMEDGDRWTDVERLAWWLCPETKDGEVVGPVED